MAWTTCSTCGSKHSTTRGCPRCTGTRKRSNGSALWWGVGALIVIVLWRTAKGLANANASGDFSEFWSIFFGG